MDKYTEKKTGQNSRLNGFSLVELMASLVVIGIVSALAIPYYYSYIERNLSQESNTFAHSLKIPVSKCIKKQIAQQQTHYSACQSNTFNIPAAINKKNSGSNIKCATVINGVIVVKADFDNDGSVDYAIKLSPIYKNRKVEFNEETSFDKSKTLLSCL